MAILKKRTMTRVSSVSYAPGKYKNLHFYVTADPAATVLTAGHFNEMRDDVQINDVIIAISAADGTGDLLIARVTAVPAAPGNVTVSVDTNASGS